MPTKGAKPELIVCPDPQVVAADAANRFIAANAMSTRAGKLFSVALAGGHTPALLYKLLASSPYSGAVDWSRTHLFFGDERCVPTDSEYSNYRMALETMIEPLGLAESNVHRIHGEMTDADQAAKRYVDELKGFFGAVSIPRFDLVLLGMGDDGHCASIFPGTPGFATMTEWAVSTAPGLKPFVDRVTLTLSVLNSAANVIFMVAGADKAQMVERVISGPAADKPLPSQFVSPVDGTLTWLIDRAAAERVLRS